jgi:hypothetical protein
MADARKEALVTALIEGLDRTLELARAAKQQFDEAGRGDWLKIIKPDGTPSLYSLNRDESYHAVPDDPHAIIHHKDGQTHRQEDPFGKIEWALQQGETTGFRRSVIADTFDLTGEWIKISENPGMFLSEGQTIKQAPGKPEAVSLTKDGRSFTLSLSLRTLEEKMRQSHQCRISVLPPPGG